MSLLEQVQNCSTKPGELATFDNPDTTTALESIGFRLLALAQLITSLITLPLILVIGPTEALVRSLSGNGRKAFAECGNCLKFHTLLAVPAATHAIFMPLKKTEQFIELRRESLIGIIADPDKYETKEIVAIEPPKIKTELGMIILI